VAKQRTPGNTLNLSRAASFSCKELNLVVRSDER
jgi:hypothetical protein